MTGQKRGTCSWVIRDAENRVEVRDWLTLGNQEPSVLFGVRDSEAHVHSSILERQYNYLVMSFSNSRIPELILSSSHGHRTYVHQMINTLKQAFGSTSA